MIPEVLDVFNHVAHGGHHVVVPAVHAAVQHGHEDMWRPEHLLGLVIVVIVWFLEL